MVHDVRELLGGGHDWRSGIAQASSGVTMFYAGETVQPPSHMIDIFECRQCHTRYYGVTVLAAPVCQACHAGRLQRVGSWNLREVAWPWLKQ